MVKYESAPQEGENKLRHISRLLLALSMLTISVYAKAAGEIVVAMRYLLPKGVSHAHLYLYREDGRLLRQLTSSNSGQDQEPIFSPDGETIVFTRLKPRGVKEFWSIFPRGGGLHKLASEPVWYAKSTSSPFFTDSSEQGPGWPAFPGQIPIPNPIPIPAQDSSVELILKTTKSYDDQLDGPGHGKQYILHNLHTGENTELGTLPGFVGLFDLLHDQNHHYFLLEGALKVAFFGLHLDSTDGDTVFALDILHKRLVRLSPNWAAPIPLPEEPAFLTLTEVRYVPIAGSSMTANCSYAERWNANLKRVRYAFPGAAICYGFSLYRPGKTPAVIIWRNE